MFTYYYNHLQISEDFDYSTGIPGERIAQFTNIKENSTVLIEGYSKVLDWFDKTRSSMVALIGDRALSDFGRLPDDEDAPGSSASSSGIFLIHFNVRISSIYNISSFHFN